MTEPLPAGFGLIPDPDLRVRDRPRVLLGGTPLRVLRLTPSGAEAVRAWFRGRPLGSRSAEGALARRLVTTGMAHPAPPPLDGAARPSVTVVVPVHDDPDGVARTLASLTADAAPDASIPVVVVDDGSGDAERLVVAVAGRARVLRADACAGPGSARERGVRGITTEAVAFVDAGVELSWAGLRRLLDHLADPEVAAVAPRVASRPGTGWIERYEQAHSPLDLGSRAAPVRPGSRVPYVPTACLVVRLARFTEVGGFDPGLRYGEDVDLVWRLAEAGHSVRYDPDVTAVHPPRPHLRGFVRQRFAYGTSAGPLAARHGDDVAPTRCSGWSVAVWATALTGHVFSAFGIAIWTAFALRRKLVSLPDAGVEAVRLTAVGHAWSARSLTEQLARTWWPVTAVASLHPWWRRRILPLAVVASIGRRWSTGRGRRGRTAVLGLIDDLAYGAGVWRGLLGRGTARAVLPGLVSWPGRNDDPAEMAPPRNGTGDGNCATGR